MAHFQGRIISLGSQGGDPSLMRPKKEYAQLSILEKRCFALAHGPLLQHTMPPPVSYSQTNILLMGSLMGLHPFSLFSSLLSFFKKSSPFLLLALSPSLLHPFFPHHLSKCKDSYLLSFSFFVSLSLLHLSTNESHIGSVEGRFRAMPFLSWVLGP